MKMLSKNLVLILFLALPLTSFAKFTNEDSLGVNIVGGNSDLTAYAFKTLNSLELDKNEFDLDGSYNYGETNGQASAENWSGNLKYSRSLTENFSLLTGELVEGDRFASIRTRYNSDLGARYKLYTSEKIKLNTEFGYRYMVEKSTEDSVADRKNSKGRTYLSFTYLKSKDVKFVSWVEYLPNFSESEDYQINIEPSIFITLTSTFSMKSAYLWKFDNLPIGINGKYDYNYTMSFIAKF